MKHKILRIFATVLLASVALSVCQVLIHKWVPVWRTPLMVIRKAENKNDESYRTKQKWVSIDRISPNMVQAVIAGEDNLFCEHKGFDYQSIRSAIDEKNRGKRLRGASTISQQTAKNVFTSGRKSWVRKGIETWYTFLIERLWGKKRIMEVYLNVAEMGKGIFGIEAASGQYFNKKAAALTLEESALIAACLPNPLIMHPDKPSSYVRKRQRTLISLSQKLERPDWDK